MPDYSKPPVSCCAPPPETPLGGHANDCPLGLAAKTLREGKQHPCDNPEGCPAGPGRRFECPAKPELERLTEGIKTIIHSRRCTDGNCIWGHPGGTHTNGGCESIMIGRAEAVRELQLIAKELRSLLAPSQPETTEPDA